MKWIAIGAKHDLVINMRAFSFPECLVNLALLYRIVLAVRPGVMHKLVHVFAKEIVDGVEAQQPGTSRIRERASAGEIDPVNAFAGGVQ
jgi:hypothetical protein